MDPRRTKTLVTLLIALGAAKANPGANATASSSTPLAKPNIIVIMADDLGYGDVSCYGATAVQTPAIDRLAREGVRFTSGYCSAS
ncbi:MAG TPA: sulfatase-like hydrolase/transferase, partial [Verrucomicrobiota bacterium]|nr:sulfatase-like hydrolase/transferase [Verrucomicrobiota bacterium]